MSKELKKRLITSFFLLSLLFLMFFYNFILIISLILIALLSWVEFYVLISRIFNKKNKENIILRFLYKGISLLYLSILTYFILITVSTNNESEIFVIYSILISVMTDIGGLTIGRIFKGKKLTKLSPKKTVSGSIGSFIFSLLLIPFFFQYLSGISLIILCFSTLVISFVSQLGDLFVSYLKRKAKVKDTSNLLPGHGGILDRVDGIIFSIPIGCLVLNYI
ncbi:phosphatidate cytidylyltransferase [Candidatus Pelagibacter sp.]|nr:phosphatidate cytidylyltransferase [Candidatus Pelagibacter sp.]